MIIRGFNRTSSPANMAVSALDGPGFTLTNTKFGYECGFYKSGASLTQSQLATKGCTLFPGHIGTTQASKLNTIDNSETPDFSSNTSAYNAGVNFASISKYIVLDMENQYGDYNNSTNLDRIGNFIKGATDSGALVGEFLYDIWNDKHVWSSNAKSQYTSPTISGIGTKNVPSLGVTLGSLYNLHLVTGYGTISVQGNQRHDPRAAIYDYIHLFRVNKKQKAVGLINHVNTASLGYLWGPSDPYGAGIPNFRHRVYMDAPYGGYTWILNRSEEDLRIMKGYAIWAAIEGHGAWYWDAQVLTSDNRNDVVDIIYSGFPSNECGTVGASNLPGSRPSPARTYPYLDGLSKDYIWEGMSEFATVETNIQNGTKSDPTFQYKRNNATNYTTVTPVTNGSYIVDAYEQGWPIVCKIVDGNTVVFVLQDPTAKHGEVTKVKVTHDTKSWLLTATSGDPKIYKFTI